jgi:hypothetical protein
VVLVVEDELVLADGPEETTSVTLEPFAASVPAAGLVLMTEFTGTVAEAWVVVVTLKPN